MFAAMLMTGAATEYENPSVPFLGDLPDEHRYLPSPISSKLPGHGLPDHLGTFGRRMRAERKKDLC